MILDLLTSSHDHQFGPRIKILLAFCSASHSRRFDMPNDHVRTHTKFGIKIFEIDFVIEIK